MGNESGKPKGPTLQALYETEQGKKIERAFNTTGPMLQSVNYGEMELRILAQEIVDLTGKPLVDKIRWVNRMIPKTRWWIAEEVVEILSSVNLLPSETTLEEVATVMRELRKREFHG